MFRALGCPCLPGTCPQEQHLGLTPLLWLMGVAPWCVLLVLHEGLFPSSPFLPTCFKLRAYTPGTVKALRCVPVRAPTASRVHSKRDHSRRVCIGAAGGGVCAETMMASSAAAGLWARTRMQAPVSQIRVFQSYSSGKQDVE